MRQGASGTGRHGIRRYHSGVNLSSRERQLLTALVILLIVVAAFQIIATLWLAVLQVADVVLIFIAAWALSYLLSPLVNRIDERTPLNRALSVVLVYLGIAIVLAGVLALVVPGLVAQLNDLVTRAPEYGDRAAREAAGLQVQPERAGVPVTATELISAAIPALRGTRVCASNQFHWVLGLTLVLHQIALNIIGPRLMSNAIGIHPIFVFLALLLGSRIAGFWGVFLAVPVAGVINTFVRYAYELAKGRRVRTQAASLMDERRAAAAAAAADARDAEAEAREAARVAREAKLTARGK